MSALNLISAWCFCVVFLQKTEALQHDLPNYITKCHRNDPKIGECLLRATEQIRPYLIKGIPELGIQSIDPLLIPTINLQQGTQALNFRAVLFNVTVKGLASYKFSQMNFDVPNLEFVAKATIDSLDLNGDYNITGKVLIAPIVGRGKFTVEVSNINLTFFKKVILVKKRDMDFFKTLNSTINIDVGGPKVTLNGLYDGNEELNRITNRVITDNVLELFEDLKPVLETIIANVAEQQLLKKLDDNVPFDKLYPKD